MDSDGIIRLPRPNFDDDTTDDFNRVNQLKNGNSQQHLDRLLDGRTRQPGDYLLPRNKHRHFDNNNVDNKANKRHKTKIDTVKHVVVKEEKRALTLDEIAEIEMWKQARRKNFPSTSKGERIEPIGHSEAPKQTKNKLTLFEKLLD